MPKAKLKFVTPDSVNMIFESLSSSGETYLFDMRCSKENKITRLIDEVKSNKYAGFLEEKYLENPPLWGKTKAEAAEILKRRTNKKRTQAS